MVYPRACVRAGMPAKTQGSNPWNIYGDRAAPIFICYEKSRLRRARGRPEKYTPVISLYLQPIRSHRCSLLPDPSGPFYSANRVPLSSIASPRFRTRFLCVCGFPSRSTVPPSLPPSPDIRTQGVHAEKNGGASSIARKVPFYLGARESLNVVKETR